MPGLVTPASWKTQQHLTLTLWAKVGASKLYFALYKGLRSRLLSSKCSVTFSKSIWNHLGSKDEGLTGGWDPPRVKLRRRRLFGASLSRWDGLSVLQKQEQQHHFQRTVYHLLDFIYLKMRWTTAQKCCLLCFDCKWSVEDRLRCKKLHLHVWTGESVSKQLVVLCPPIQIAILKPKDLQP